MSVISGHIRGETNTMPLLVEILYNEYDLGDFANGEILGWWRKKVFSQFGRLSGAAGPYHCAFHEVLWWLHRERYPWCEFWP
jgi:hypothetical protein